MKKEIKQLESRILLLRQEEENTKSNIEEIHRKVTRIKSIQDIKTLRLEKVFFNFAFYRNFLLLQTKNKSN